jgi:Heterokaryon incompatibility protein (HET)
MKQSVPWNSIPQTYRDAITVCRELDLPCLWIDSLCIRQDDREDWAHEAEKMAGIYGTAHLVIAANYSATPEYSLLSHQRPASVDDKVVAWTDDEPCQPLLYLHKVRSGGLHNDENRKSYRDPLDSRG